MASGPYRAAPRSLHAGINPEYLHHAMRIEQALMAPAVLNGRDPHMFQRVIDDLATMNAANDASGESVLLGIAIAANDKFKGLELQLQEACTRANWCQLEHAREAKKFRFERMRTWALEEQLGIASRPEPDEVAADDLDVV